MIESTTEIYSLEGTSPRETVSTSVHRVPNTLIADYRREEKFFNLRFKWQICYPQVTDLLQITKKTYKYYVERE